MKKDIDKGRDGTKIAHFETTSFMVGPLRHELQYVESHEEPRFLFVGCNCSLGALTCHVQWGNLSSFTFCSWFCPLNGAPKFMHAFPGQIPGYFAIRLYIKGRTNSIHSKKSFFLVQQTNMQPCKNLVDSQQILGLICKANYVLKSQETKVHKPNLTSNGNEKNFR